MSESHKVHLHILQGLAVCTPWMSETSVKHKRMVGHTYPREAVASFSSITIPETTPLVVPQTRSRVNYSLSRLGFLYLADSA